MLITEEKIRAKEQEIHLNVPYRYKGKTKYHEKVIGYLSEDLQQADYIQWAWHWYPELRFCLFHIKNEGNDGSKRARMIGAQDLTKGKLKGVFDNLCVLNNRMVLIEIKLPGEDMSPDQKDLYKLWTSMGVEVYIAKTFDEWKYLIESVILWLY